MLLTVVSKVNKSRADPIADPRTIYSISLSYRAYSAVCRRQGGAKTKRGQAETRATYCKNVKSKTFFSKRNTLGFSE